MLCEYGCGKEVTHQFKNGKWCCSDKAQKCEKIKTQSSKKLKEQWNDPTSGFHSKERSEKLSKSSKKNMIEGSLYRENLIKKIKQKWKDPDSNYNKKEFYDKMKESGAKRFYKKIKTNSLCDYGCDQKAKYLFPKNGKYCCEKSWQSCSARIKESQKLTKLHIRQIKEKYPTFSKVEEMRYNPDKPDEKEIQVHCKNHLCKNSKEQYGWFTPKNREIFFNRIYAIENDDGNGAMYLYCSEHCKDECPLYNKKITELIKIDQIEAGYIKEELYTSSEYQTFRQIVLKRENYLCEYCEEPATDVHHSRPQKLEPGFVLDPDFGIACCEKCHYQYGHKTGTECSTGNLANKICQEVI